MKARKVKPEEVKRTEELFSISFNASYDNQEAPSALYERYISSPGNREQEHCLERFAAFEDDDVTMMSSFIMQPFEIRFDNYTEPMLSIGGVATLPQYRRRGGIRACFEEALPYLYDKGTVFSYLYPFSTAYYRKFGYEICCRRQNYRIALNHIPAFKEAGTCYLAETSKKELALQDISYIYKRWQEKYNMMVKWNQYDYAFIADSNPLKDQIFTYVYRTEEGKPAAYMTFKCEASTQQRQLICSSFFYTRMEGLRGLLALAKTMAADFSDIRFSLPAELTLESVLPEWSMEAVSCEVIPHGMVRVINARSAMRDACYRGSGAIVIEIIDAYILQNNGVFEVKYEEGRSSSIMQSDKQPDISLTIADFSALIAGGYDFESYAVWDTIKVHGNEEEIKKIFYKKPIYINNLF